VQNADIARIFDEVADLLEVQAENPFRIRAYRSAARSILDYPESLEDVVRAGTPALTDLPGIGEDLADKIRTIVKTGALPMHADLSKKVPPGLLDLLRVPGLGPKRVEMLHAKLGVKSAADLGRVIRTGRIRKLPGFGPRMIEKVMAGLGQAEHVERRLLLNDAEAYATAMVAYLKHGGGITDIEVAGSYRRRRETVGDLDILVTCRDTAKVIQRFAAYPDVGEVVSKGTTRATVRLRGGLQIDLRAVEPAAYGAALLYFTGSKAHNLELRAMAQDRKLKLNEYGLFAGARRVAGKTEREIYSRFGLAWIPPELREARGEIALARARKLPKLVTLEEIRGDLQMHTTASDGRASLGEMADAARARGYRYIAITDHSRRVTMAHGLDPKRLRAQWKEVEAWNRRHRGFTILKSVEVDILESGKLDLPDEVLAEADYVVASLHYGFRQKESQITRRLVGAAEHPYVDAIGHPTGRLLGKREPYALDFDALATAAAGAGCLLEVNGHPERMDLPDTLAATALRQGATVVLSTDSHHPGNLAFMRYAVDIARRAGLRARDIANTRPLAAFRALLKRNR
jgi:DNA polymerase (family X)